MKTRGLVSTISKGISTNICEAITQSRLRTSLKGNELWWHYAMNIERPRATDQLQRQYSLVGRIRNSCCAAKQYHVIDNGLSIALVVCTYIGNMDYKYTFSHIQNDTCHHRRTSSIREPRTVVSLYSCVLTMNQDTCQTCSKPTFA